MPDGCFNVPEYPESNITASPDKTTEMATRFQKLLAYTAITKYHDAAGKMRIGVLPVFVTNR